MPAAIVDAGLGDFETILKVGTRAIYAPGAVVFELEFLLLGLAMGFFWNKRAQSD